MSWPEQENQYGSDVITRGDPLGTTELFPGDLGELALDTRRVLAQLLAGPFLDGRRHSKLWPALLRDERIIRGRLCELFLDLVVDRDAQVAFTRRADVGELEAPVLLRMAPLTFLDSALLLFLRQRLLEADAQGQRAAVSNDEILDHLSVYERALNTDRSGFNRRIKASIEKIKVHGILQRIRSTEDRFEISPTLRLLFSVEAILALTQIYRQIAANGNIVPSDEESRPEDAAE